MDLEEFRSFISDSGVDVWSWIDMAISVAAADHQIELRNRRDGIIQKLYATAFPTCHSCLKNEINLQIHDDDQDQEQRKILEIKNLLDDHTQDDKSLIGLLQRLLDMNTTFKTLKETEIGRHVTKLRKHSSNEVRRLVKVLVKKWRDTVDEWVNRQNTTVEEEFNGERKSPDEASIHKGVKPVSSYSTPPKRKADEVNRIGLNDQDNEESQHAKKQTRLQQVMDIHGISKLKNSVFPNNGGSIPIKYWRAEKELEK
ncbi:hypothetical protein C2S51_019334 [Perilla frutescens var. frutescens]|nr:hypothetical protein C2S51_019334 [Perilla frutescens var. frutescens]